MDATTARSVTRGGFTYSVVASPLHDAATVGALTAPARELLDGLGGGQVAVDGAPGLPHVHVVATGGTERALLDLVDRRRVVHPFEPVVLVAHGAHNSLPAALETMAALRQRGVRGRIVYLADDRSDREVLAEALGDLEAIHRFHSTQLGLVGGPSSWLVASSPSAAVVRDTWGPTVVTVDPSRMIDASRSAEALPTHEFAVRFTSRADPGRTVVSATDVAQAAAVGTALIGLVETDRLDAVSVRCFDLLSDPGTSGCLALAALNDDGVVAGCEGDIPSTLAMLAIRYVLDQPSWMANPARIDVARNRLLLAHCTVAPSMIEDFALSTHFESGIGVGISGRFAERPVTLVRVGGTRLDRHWIADGRIVAIGDDRDLCRTQVTVEVEGHSLEELLTDPLGNHLTLTSGHHRARLERWWQLAIAS